MQADLELHCLHIAFDKMSSAVANGLSMIRLLFYGATYKMTGINPFSVAGANCNMSYADSVASYHSAHRYLRATLSVEKVNEIHY